MAGTTLALVVGLMTWSGTEFTRVRADTPALSRLMQEASHRSPTFRGLMERIQATDGIVYVVNGRCRERVRACLLFWIGTSDRNRILRVVVDDHRQREEAMSFIAHELRHALEVLDEPSVTTGGGMYLLYSRIGSGRGHTFETQAARDTEDAVYQELKRTR